MNDFDRILFEELTKEYKQNNLSKSDQEDLFQRFLSIDYLDEVKPYLIVMRYLGLGTPKDKNALNELKGMIGKKDYILAGLYYDLYLMEKDSPKAYQRLLKMQEKGYTDIYLNQYSHLPKKIVSENKLYHIYPKQSNNPILFFETKSPNPGWKDPLFKGYEFTSDDITYLSVYLLIESDADNVELKTSSQIFMDGEPLSKVMYCNFELIKGINLLRTSGYGSESGGSFKAGHEYEWKVILDDKIYSRNFIVYPGIIDVNGVPIKQKRLYECKIGTKFNKPVSKFASTFDQPTLEQVRVRCFIESPRETKYICTHITFSKLGDLNKSNEIAFVSEIKPDQRFFDLPLEGYDEPGQWRKGTYRYTLGYDAGKTYEGTFEVI